MRQRPSLLSDCSWAGIKKQDKEWKFEIWGKAAISEVERGGGSIQERQVAAIFNQTWTAADADADAAATHLNWELKARYWESQFVST